MKDREFDKGALEFFNENYDFMRCQRPDGSFYGTSGVCRKGTKVDAKEKKPAAAKAKIERKTGGTLVQSADLENFRGDETVARLTNRNVDLKQHAKENPDEADIVQTQLDKNNKIIENRRKNNDVLENIVANVPAGTEVSIMPGTKNIQMEQTTPSGQKIKAVFGNKDYNFQVNGGYDAGTVKTRPQQIEVANAVRRNFEAVVKSLPQGAVIGTAAWTEDGRGGARTKAYERMGFSKPAGGPGGNQYAKKSGGKMVPSNQSEEGLDKSYSFAEKMDNTTALWILAIFGVGGKNN